MISIFFFFFCLIKKEGFECGLINLMLRDSNEEYQVYHMDFTVIITRIAHLWVLE